LPSTSEATEEELDPGVLEGLLDALDLTAALLDLGLAVADQVAQLALRARRHEAGLDQPVLDQLAAPLGVLDVALAAGDVANMASVVEPALEFVLEQVEDGSPVDAGRFHPDHGHRIAAQPVGQRDKPRGRRAELADLLAAPAATVRHAHARRDLRLVDVEHRAPLDQTIHQTLPDSDNAMAARESLMRWSLNRVLKATVRGARDSRVPLISGLAGTKQSRRRPRRPRPPFSSVPGGPARAHESLIWGQDGQAGRVSCRVTLVVTVGCGLWFGVRVAAEREGA
jgi:hypothetical protein